MIKWPITYTTYDDETLTEDFYFNLSKAELMQIQFDANGTYSQFIGRIINERDFKHLGEEFRKIILKSYGKKSDDGKQFRKTPEIQEEFEFSPAYSELYVQLMSDSESATKFFTGILPRDLQGDAKKAANELMAGNGQVAAQ